MMMHYDINMIESMYINICIVIRSLRIFLKHSTDINLKERKVTVVLAKTVGQRC